MNRIDEVILFNRLARKHMGSILDIRMAELHAQLEGNEHHIKLDIDETAKQWLCEKGYDPSYGARPLNRAIQVRVLCAPLAAVRLTREVRNT